LALERGQLNFIIISFGAIARSKEEKKHDISIYLVDKACKSNANNQKKA
jgi:hypothetical protein